MKVNLFIKDAEVVTFISHNNDVVEVVYNGTQYFANSFTSLTLQIKHISKMIFGFESPTNYDEDRDYCKFLKKFLESCRWI